MSDDFDKDEWGNIELPGLSDEELLGHRANVIINNRRRAKGADPNWLAATVAKNKELAKDLEWLAKMDALNKERAADPESFWNKQNRAGAQRRSEYGKWLKENDPEEYKRYFGTVDNHTEETIAQMKESATNRWKDPAQRQAHSMRFKGVKKNTIVCEHCGKEMSTSNYKKYGHHTAKCQIYTIMIEGVKYFNVSDAKEKLGVGSNTIRSRLKSKTNKWQAWYFMENNNEQ